MLRAVPPPSENAQDRSDMLVSVVSEEFGSSLPVFVACADGPTRVIPTLLSVYHRRHRLPEPSEVYFCSGSGAPWELENVTLLMQRWAHAKAHGLGDRVFCIANVHNLTYTQQCAIVDTLRRIINEYGTEQVATLLFLSGKPRQVLLNTLSSQSIDLPALDDSELRDMCLAAMQEHLGVTTCVRANTNGGGKSHYLLDQIARYQEHDATLLYRKILLRESSTAGSLVHAFRKASDVARVAFHVDISHVIPQAANTILCELLLIGVLRDPLKCVVYHRRPQDLFFLEIPNSPKDKTYSALRFCHILPFKYLNVEPAELSFTKPELLLGSDGLMSRVRIRPYNELTNTCHWTRAWKAGKFNPPLVGQGGTCLPEWFPFMEEEEPLDAEAVYAMVQERLTA